MAWPGAGVFGRFGCVGVCVPGHSVESGIYLAIKYASRVFLIFIINLKAHRASCKKAFNLIMLAINCRFIWPAWRVNARTPASLIKCPPGTESMLWPKLYTDTHRDTDTSANLRDTFCASLLPPCGVKCLLVKYSKQSLRLRLSAFGLSLWSV